jgi:hypothetical protein
MATKPFLPDWKIVIVLTPFALARLPAKFVENPAK